MAKIIENATFTHDRSEYAWDTWLDGQAYLIERGVDYKCEDVTMLTLLRNQAKKRGLSVRTMTVKGDGGGIQFQAYPASDEQRAEWAKQDAAARAKKAAAKLDTTTEPTIEDAALIEQMDKEVKKPKKRRSKKADAPMAETVETTNS